MNQPIPPLLINRNPSKPLAMCNTVTIHYTCNHFAQFHRSTCRSIFWVTKSVGKIKKHPKAKKSYNKDKSSKDSPRKESPIRDSNDHETPDRGRTLDRTSTKTSSSRSSSRNRSKPRSPSTHSLSPAPKLVSKAACKSYSDVVFRSPRRCGPCIRDSTRRIFDLARNNSKTESEYPCHKKRKHLRRHARVSGGSPLKHELSIEELLQADEEERMDMESTDLVKSSTKAINGIAELLHLEPAKFWRCWRRFDDMGRRYAGFVKD